MTTRRRFLQLTAAVVAWAGGRKLVRADARPLLFAHILPAPSTAATQGALLAAEEAARAAELLGTRITLRTGLPGDAAKLIDQGALALIGGLDAATRTALIKLSAAREVPLLTTREPSDTSPDEPLHEHVFHVASTPKDRHEALERWKPKETTQNVDIVDWHPTLTRFGAEQLNQRYEEKFGTPMQPLAWTTWMAVKAATEAALRGADTPADLARRLTTMGFDGHKGVRLHFRPDNHHLQQPLYAVTGDRVLAEISSEEEDE
jgi:ABC-type branched-subunit amino acid transport system substrate-binding protein